MISIIYISNAATHLTTVELDGILATSRRNNAGIGVTGMLIHMDGSFIQVLEGEAEVVDPLVARIAEDRRHRDFVVIARYPVAARQFPDWSMGYRRCDGGQRRAQADRRLPPAQPGLTGTAGRPNENGAETGPVVSRWKYPVASPRDDAGAAYYRGAMTMTIWRPSRRGNDSTLASSPNSSRTRSSRFTPRS